MDEIAWGGAARIGTNGTGAPATGCGAVAGAAAAGAVGAGAAGAGAGAGAAADGAANTGADATGTAPSVSVSGAGSASVRKRAPTSKISPLAPWILVVGERGAACSTSFVSSSSAISLPAFPDSPRR
ncbi:MAG: hypothetical protein E6H76_04460 [Betaproteobacteria bacterium]|nr:MAG: hypothetical protein E6H76_04460 [Betaproteobacteria bacterium]